MTSTTTKSPISGVDAMRLAEKTVESMRDSIRTGWQKNSYALVKLGILEGPLTDQESEPSSELLARLQTEVLLYLVDRNVIMPDPPAFRPPSGHFKL